MTMKKMTIRLRMAEAATLLIVIQKVDSVNEKIKGEITWKWQLQ